MVEVMINGPDGRLEARYHHAEAPGAPVALVLHPHPQHGGTMNNKVVYAIYQCFRERGFSVLRFNFRGVGRSQGKFDQGFGELSDAAAALDWLQTHNANASRCWIAGFSFGAWIAMQVLMRRPEIHGFVAISPPANHFDFSFLAPCPSSGLIVQGNKDDVVPEANVAKLAQRLQNQRHIEVDYRVIKGANHFFEDKMDVLTTTISGYLQKSVAPAAVKKAAAVS